MNHHQWCLSVQLCIALCGLLTSAVTESTTGFTSPVHPSNGEPPSSATPPPGGTEAVDTSSVGTAEAATLDSTPTPPPGGEEFVDPTSVGTTEAVTLDSTEAATLTSPEVPAVVTEVPPATTAQPVGTSEGNLHLSCHFQLIGNGLMVKTPR